MSGIPVNITTKNRAVQLQDFYQVVKRGDKTMPPLLFDLLSTATPHGMEHFMYGFLPPLQNKNKVWDKYDITSVTRDQKGNHIVRVGKPEESSTLFSSHLDTVQKAKGEKGKKKKTKIYLGVTDKNDKKIPEGMIYAHTYDEKGNIVPSVLGADDKVGVYIMLQMIYSKVKGLYVFHVGEEVGCVGSNWLLTNTPDILKGIDRAIAFDRMNYGDIVNSQRGTTCASTEFVTALARQLNDILLDQKVKTVTFKGARGSYTDTAVYMKNVPEITNLSVGYFDQHSTSEHFDVIWLKYILMPLLLKMDWETLPTSRDPKAVPTYSYYNSYTGYTGGSVFEKEEEDGTIFSRSSTSPIGFQHTDAHSAILPTWKPHMGLVKPYATLPSIHGANNVTPYVEAGVRNGVLLNKRLIRKWIENTPTPDLIDGVLEMMIRISIDTLNERSHKTPSTTYVHPSKAIPNVMAETDPMQDFSQRQSGAVIPLAKRVEASRKSAEVLDDKVDDLFSAPNPNSSSKTRFMEWLEIYDTIVERHDQLVAQEAKFDKPISKLLVNMNVLIKQLNRLLILTDPAPKVSLFWINGLVDIGNNTREILSYVAKGKYNKDALIHNLCVLGTLWFVLAKSFLYCNKTALENNPKYVYCHTDVNESWRIQLKDVVSRMHSISDAMHGQVAKLARGFYSNKADYIDTDTSVYLREDAISNVMATSTRCTNGMKLTLHLPFFRSLFHGNEKFNSNTITADK